MDGLVLTAAGSSARFGGSKSKVFWHLGGKPVLLRSLAPFRMAIQDLAVVITARASDLATVRSLVPGAKAVVGGSTRQESVLRGLEALPHTVGATTDIVLVHDAARPLLSVDLVRRVAAAARRDGAAAAVLPVGESVHRVSGAGAPRVTECIDRSGLVAAQTPQAARLDLLRRALTAAEAAGAQETDEVAALVRAGIPVTAVEGERWNLKITVPDDLLLAGEGPRGRGARVSEARRTRVIGIDPGTRIVGYGIVDAQGTRMVSVAFGVLRAPPERDIALRLAALARGLREVLAAHRPEEAAIEEAFYGKDVRATLRIGEGRGAAMVVLADAGIPVTGYANNVVKRAVTGAGRAPKDRVQAMVTRLLSLHESPHPFDATDALALALCHHQRRTDPTTTSRDRPGLPPRVLEAIAAARTRDRRGGMVGAVTPTRPGSFDLLALAVAWPDVSLALVFSLAEVLAVFSAWALTAIEIHSRARILDLGVQAGKKDWAARHLQRLPTYDLTVRLTRFVGNAVLVVGTAWLLLRSHRGGASAPDGHGDEIPWGPLLGVLAIGFCVTFLVNDVVVRLLARRRPNRFLFAAFPSLAVLRRLTTPIRVPTKLLAWLFFRVSLESAGPGAREEVRLAVQEGRRSGGFTEAEADILEAVIDIDRSTVDDILTTRGEMVMLKADAGVWEAAAVAHMTGHSRFPVYGKDKEDVIGYVTVRDLLAHFGRMDPDAPRVRDVMRKPFFVPDSKPARDLLGEMRSRRVHIAIVLDSLGTVRGLVTIEDLLEQLVGDIVDEYDIPSSGGSARTHATAPSGKQGSTDLDGRTPIVEVNRALGIDLPQEGDFETIGGLVLHRLGRVPEEGDRLGLDSVVITVTSADERTARRVRVEVRPPAPPESAV